MDMAGTRLDSMAVKRLAKQFGYSEIRFHHVSPFKIVKTATPLQKTLWAEAKMPSAQRVKLHLNFGGSAAVRIVHNLTFGVLA